jgi:hypothetical protein
MPRAYSKAQLGKLLKIPNKSGKIMHKIKRVSHFFRILFQITFVVLPLLVVWFWIQAPHPVGLTFMGWGISFINSPYSSWQILHALTPGEKLIGFILSWLTIGAAEVTIYFLIKLFRLYENAEIFTLQNVVYIRNIAYALLIGQLLAPIQQALMSFALTWHNPHGYRVMTISVTGSNFGVILMALLILLISWVMAEGCRLQAEQELTI